MTDAKVYVSTPNEPGLPATLVTVLPDGRVTVAHRCSSWESWGPPSEASPAP